MDGWVSPPPPRMDPLHGDHHGNLSTFFCTSWPRGHPAPRPPCVPTASLALLTATRPVSLQAAHEAGGGVRGRGRLGHRWPHGNLCPDLSSFYNNNPTDLLQVSARKAIGGWTLRSNGNPVVGKSFRSGWRVGFPGWTLEEEVKLLRGLWMNIGCPDPHPSGSQSHPVSCRTGSRMRGKEGRTRFTGQKYELCTSPSPCPP